MKSFKDYVSEVVAPRKPLRIVRKNWKTDYPGYKVEFNNLSDHPLIPRIQDRTNLSITDIGNIFDKAILYIIKKNDKGFFRQKSMVEFLMKKSEFKVLIMINPEDKYIRFSTVLSKDMPSKNTIKWSLNEDEEELEVISFELDY